MKILLVSNMYPSEQFPSYGIFVKNFCKQLDELDISYSTSVMKKSKNKIGKIFRYILFHLVTFLKCLFVDYDVVYIHYASHSSVSVILATLFRNIRIYTNVHGSDIVPENKKQERMQIYTNKILSISEKIIVPSEYFKEYVQLKYSINSNKLFVSPSGGVDSEIFYKEDSVTNSTDVFRIGFVGRISYKKGWDTFIDACSLIDNKNYEIIIVGSGPEEELMKKKISEKGMENRIHHYDLLPQDKLRGIYNKIDVFVFPTEREGESLGLVAIEAMACGRPVIASSYAAPAKYVVDGFNGFKFEMGNSVDLADKIESFRMLSSEKRKELESGALLTAKQYDKEKVKEGIKKIILGYYNDKSN